MKRPDLKVLPTGTYVSTWMNELHEEMIFTREPGAKTGTLFHSDNDWHPVTVKANDQEAKERWVTNTLLARGMDVTDARMQHFLGVAPASRPGELVLDFHEQSWLDLCWNASEPAALVQREKTAGQA